MINKFLVNICGFDPIILKKDDIADLTFRRFASGFFLVIILSFLSTLMFLSVQLKILLLVFYWQHFLR